MSELIASLNKEKSDRIAAALAAAKKDRFFNRGNALLTEFLKTREEINVTLTKHLVRCLEVLQQNLVVISSMPKEIETIKVTLESEKKRKARHSTARRRKTAKLAELEKTLVSLNNLFGMITITVRSNLEISHQTLLPVKKYQSLMDRYNEWCEEAWETYEEEISEFLHNIGAHSKPDIFNVVQGYGSLYTKGDLWFNESLNNWLDDYQDRFEEMEEKLKSFIK